MIKLKEIIDSEFDAQTFFARWFMSKKDMIPKTWYEYVAKKYPYKGQAFRLDKTPFDKPYASWCKTTNGLIQWKLTMNPLGQTPTGWYNYSGTIDRGCDLVEFAKDNIELIGMETAKLIIDVEEVFPITRVKDIIEL